MESLNGSFLVDQNDNGTEYNTTTSNEGLTTFAKVTVSLQLIMMVVVLTGNILVIIATLKFKSLWNVTGVFVCNLAVADVFMGLVLPFQVVYFFHPEIQKNEIICLLRYLPVSFSCKASVYSLTCTVFDRYIAIVYPFRYPSIMTFRNAYILVAIIWIFDIGVTIIPLTGVNDFEMVPYCIFQLITRGGLRLFNNLSTMSFSAVMAVLYIRIYTIVRRHARQIAASEVDRSVFDNYKKAKQMNNIVALVVIFFHASWLPYFILQLTMVRKEDVTQSKVIASSYLVFLGILNSVVNPFIYAWKNKTYREAFKKILSLQFDREQESSSVQTFC